PMPPLPIWSRISSCGKNRASSAMVGGTNGGCAGPPPSVAMPRCRKQDGQRPSGASGGKATPHCGQLFMLRILRSRPWFHKRNGPHFLQKENRRKVTEVSADFLTGGNRGNGEIRPLNLLNSVPSVSSC